MSDWAAQGGTPIQAAGADDWAAQGGAPIDLSWAAQGGTPVSTGADWHNLPMAQQDEGGPGGFAVSQPSWQLPTMPQPNNAAYLGAEAIRPERGQEMPYMPDGRVVVPGQGTIGAAGAQAVQSFGQGIGSAVAGLGDIPEGAFQGAQSAAEKQLAVMDRIDRGENVPAMDDPLGYGDIQDPAQRAQFRRAYQATVQQQRAELDARDPNALQQAGRAISQFAENQFPVDSAQANATLTKIGGAVGGLPPLLMATTVGGPVAGAALAGIQSYDATYQAAKAKGATEMDAHNAALQSGLSSAALMAPNAAILLKGLPIGIQNSVVGAALNYAAAGGSMIAQDQAQRMIDNAIAQQSYDPTRNLLQGVGGTSDLIAAGLGGVAAHGAMHLPGAVRAGVAELASPDVAPELQQGAARMTEAARDYQQAQQAPQEAPPAAQEAVPAPETAQTPGASQQAPAVTEAPVQAPTTPERDLTGIGKPYSAGQLDPRIEDAVRQEAQKRGIDPNWMVALFRAEGGGFDKVSSAGAMGPAQLMPGTARELGVDPRDWQQNVAGGVEYFQRQLDRFDGDYAAATAAYNAGPANKGVIRFHENGDHSALPDETRNYVATIAGLAKEPSSAGRTVESAQPEQTQAPMRVYAGDIGIDVQPKVVELSDLTTSHDAEGGVNPDYPHADGLQPRDRTSLGSQAQVREIASKLNPSLLAPQPDASGGAPIVSPGGNVVENGNGRVAALSLAYRDPELAPQADAYREFLRQQGYDISGMREPVLISQRLTPLDRLQLQQFISDTANRNTLAMTPAERARADAALAGRAIDLWHGSNAASAANAPFVRAFMQGIPAAERGNLVGSDGQLSQAGGQRVQSAVVAHAYGDQLGSTLDRFVNDEAGGLKTIAGALSDGAGAWAQMRAEAARGFIPGSLDITPDLAHAVQIVDQARQTGYPVRELLAQQDFDRPVSPMTADLVRSFYRNDNMTLPSGRQVIADRLREYAQQAMHTPPGNDIFGNPPPAAPEVMKAASLRLAQRAPGARDMLSRRDAQRAAAETARDPDVKAIPVEAVEARERLRTAAQAVMRYVGLPEDVGLRLVDRIAAGDHGADGSYTRGLLELALDTRPDLLPQKLVHETTHALMDPGLGLLTSGQRQTLLHAADAWLKVGDRRSQIERLYGNDPGLVREEAVARMGEQTFQDGMQQRSPVARVYGRMLNAVRGLGQVLRGQGYTTADDVFRGVLRGERAQPGAEALSMPSAGQERTQPDEAPTGQDVAAASEQTEAPGEIASQPTQQAAPTDAAAARTLELGQVPDRYLAKRDRAPLLSDKTALEDAGQAVMPGVERDERGALQRKADAALAPKATQRPSNDLPLFSFDQKQASLFSLRENLISALRDSTEEPRRRLNDMLNTALFPMRAGTKQAQDIAFKFANALRGIQFRYGQIDRQLKAQFTPEERSAMGRALDAQSVFEQDARGGKFQDVATARAAFDASRQGLAKLTDRQRQHVQVLDQLAQQTWQRLQDRKLVVPGAEGLPSYMPRRFVMMDGLTGARRITAADSKFGPEGSSGAGLTSMDQKGRNLTTNPGINGREHLTPEESTAAARAKYGDNVALVTDIRSLVDAIQRQERAIAGRDLVDAIKRIGVQSGLDLVREGVRPDHGYFTLDHPALWTVGPTGAEDANGKPIYGRIPVHIDEQFRGPLNAVLSSPNPDWYRAVMAVKNRSMALIMLSPAMHLMVEIGRSLPLYHADPAALIFSIKRGSRLVEDRALTDQAIRDGLAPIGRGWDRVDPTSIMNDAAGLPSKTLLGKVWTGDTALQRGFHHLHQRALWDQVFNLQAGIYGDMRARHIDQGFPPGVAGKMAAHLANRYAGALPPEHLSKGANMLANVGLFSRSFTLGNLAVMKDMLTGMPSHVRAAIEAELGPNEMDSNSLAKKAGKLAWDAANFYRSGDLPRDSEGAQRMLRRKAMSTFALDIGMFFVVNGIAQAGFAAARNWANGDDVPAAASKAWQDYIDHYGLPQLSNEPGKTDRVYVGQDTSGRGIYARIPFGKVGEEFLGWMPIIGHPGQTIEAKLNPLFRALWESVTGKDSLGRDIYNPSPQTTGQQLEKAGQIVLHIARSLGPSDFLDQAYELATGQARGDKIVAVARTLGPMAGISISSGYPTGPQAGAEHAALATAEYYQTQAKAEARRLVALGREDDARAVLDKAYGNNARGAASAMRSIMNPNKSAVRLDRQFNRTANENDKARAAGVTGSRINFGP